MIISLSLPFLFADPGPSVERIPTRQEQNRGSRLGVENLRVRSPINAVPSQPDPSLREVIRLRDDWNRDAGDSETISHLNKFPQKPEALGILRISGEVSVNNSPVTVEGTIFVGDLLHTGANGTATITIPERGTLVVQQHTMISFADEPTYFATLQTGSVSFRSLPGAQHAQIRVGDVSVFPQPTARATSEIHVAEDGTAQIRCLEGSIGILQLEGAQTTFLNPGEELRVAGTGEFLVPAKPPTPTPAPSTPPPSAGHGRTGWIILAVAGGGGAAAAAVLAGRKGRESVSPSNP